MVPLDARINDVYGDKKKKKGREETIFLRTYDQKGKKKTKERKREKEGKDNNKKRNGKRKKE